MKDLVIETIRLYFGYLEGVSTEEFYNEYLKICSDHDAEPLSRHDVTKIASDLSGCHSKKKTISIFAKKVYNNEC